MWARPSLFFNNRKDLAHSPTNTLWPRPSSADHRRKLALNDLVELLVKERVAIVPR